MSYKTTSLKIKFLLGALVLFFATSFGVNNKYNHEFTDYEIEFVDSTNDSSEITDDDDNLIFLGAESVNLLGSLNDYKEQISKLNKLKYFDTTFNPSLGSTYNYKFTVYHKVKLFIFYSSLKLPFNLYSVNTH